jgi:hypothetical protein
MRVYGHEPTVVERLARAGVAAAARRWPDDLAEVLLPEWYAELSALRLDARLTGARRAYRMLAFAGSLAVSPTADATWPGRITGGARAASVTAGVTLLGAALFNASHAVGGPGLLILAGVLMAVLGSRVRMSLTAATVLLGAALFGFLFVGNDGAVMPFLGFADVAPAVAAWTVAMLLVVRAGGHPAVRGRAWRRPVVAVAGGLVALDLAVVAGSLRAAAALGVGPGSAPAWFPLSLLPGGVVGFGPFHADGSGSFGPLTASGPAFHASDILLANAAAMAGPMLLCTVFLIALALRHAAPEAIGSNEDSHAAVRAGASQSRRVAAGVLGALGGLAVGEVLRGSAPAADTLLHRLVENSAVFGFGFLAHPAGQALTALLAALLTIRSVEAWPAGQRRA